MFLKSSKFESFNSLTRHVCAPENVFLIHSIVPLKCLLKHFVHTVVVQCLSTSCTIPSRNSFLVCLLHSFPLSSDGDSVTRVLGICLLSPLLPFHVSSAFSVEESIEFLCGRTNAIRIMSAHLFKSETKSHSKRLPSLLDSNCDQVFHVLLLMSDQRVARLAPCSGLHFVVQISSFPIPSSSGEMFVETL